MVFLLAVAIFINYIDRGSLAAAAPLIKDELKLSNSELGVLSSAFFWIYAPSQLLAAWVVQRINPYRALLYGLTVWSLATALSSLATGFVMLLGLRTLLGLGESVGFPASSKLLAQHLPHHRLGSANALISAGICLGPAAGSFLGGLLLAHLGWRALFLAFGGASLLWLAPWWFASRSLSAHPSSARGAPEPSYRELLAKKEIWGAALGHFANNYAFYLVLSWLPLYLVKEHGYTLGAMGRLAGLVYAFAAVIGLVAAALADRSLAKGASATLVRKGTMCIGIIIGIIGMLACATGVPTVAIFGLLLYSVFHGLCSFNNFTIAQTLSGAGAAAKWVGIQNCVGNLAGILGPLVTGLLIDWTGGFRIAFLIAAAVLVAGLISWGLIIGRVEPIQWTTCAR